MEYRQLGGSGLRVPVLSFGTATFGGGNEFFKAWGETGQAEADRLVALCLDHGVNFFDTANVYSAGVAEQTLGAAIRGRRDELLLSTKATFAMGDGANQFGSSRYGLVRECEASLQRLGTDYIDVYFMHAFDATTPIEETLRALDDLVTSGKVRYIGCSNFSGWQLMKSLSISERYGWNRYVVHQAYYSLLNREFEWELMPLGIDQRVGTMVWSPLSGGQLSGKIRRGEAAPAGSRFAQQGSHGPAKPVEFLYDLVDVLEQVAAEVDKTVAQVALNWLLRRPTVDNIVVGARNEQQLLQNIAAVGWELTVDQVKRLDAVSQTPAIYPYWHQRQTAALQSDPDLYGERR